MEWEVEYTDEVEEWWSGLLEEEQDEIDAKVELPESLPRRLDIPNCRLSSSEGSVTD